MRERPPSSRPVIASVLACLLAACAALPALEAAAPEIATAAGQGIAALVQAEAAKQNIPPTDPQYQQALAEAKALDAQQALDAKAVLAKQQLILTQLRKRPLCAPAPPVDAGPVAPAPTSPVTVVVLDAGADAGKDAAP